MDLNNSIIFGGIDSANYGIYIAGNAVFNSPERDVTMIDVPGRNGQLTLDNGRFMNIEVTYNAFVTGDNSNDIADNIRGYRNAIGSLIGYQRLEDTFHTDEYRQAIFRNGIEVEPAIYQTGGYFDITFDCKPQRFLTSGETAVAVANNGTINNGTKFEAHPQLQIWGYGAVTLTDQAGNANTVNIVSAPIGEIELEDRHDWKQANDPYTITLDLSLLNVGDTFHFDRLYFGTQFVYVVGNQTTLTAENSNNAFATTTGPIWTTRNNQNCVLLQTRAEPSFMKGTSQTVTNTNTVKENGTTLFALTQTVAYDGTSTITINQTVSAGATIDGALSDQLFKSIIGTSSQSALGSPIYIDLDIGEAYKIVSDDIVGVNNAVILPSVPPTLKQGNTTITYPNTVTQFKIVPRWWRI